MVVADLGIQSPLTRLNDKFYADKNPTSLSKLYQGKSNDQFRVFVTFVGFSQEQSLGWHNGLWPGIGHGALPGGRNPARKGTGLSQKQGDFKSKSGK
jgi:hypothetical protein